MYMYVWIINNPSGRRFIWTFFKRHGKTEMKIEKKKEMYEYSIYLKT